VIGNTGRKLYEDGGLLDCLVIDKFMESRILGGDDGGF